MPQMIILRSLNFLQGNTIFIKGYGLTEEIINAAFHKFGETLLSVVQIDFSIVMLRRFV